MPHITLEFSSNVLEKNVSPMLIQMHELLSAQLPTPLKNCKSRIVRSDDYVIGDANESNAFVHLSILVLKGRSVDLKNGIASNLLKILKEHFAESTNLLDLQISVTIEDLPDVFLK
jgi:5-carboxymethyl-2-hydroxymuconate isomerase